MIRKNGQNPVDDSGFNQNSEHINHGPLENIRGSIRCLGGMSSADLSNAPCATFCNREKTKKSVDY